MTIQFCGAAQEVTGSCHLITLSDGFTILLDCGLYQGNSENLKNFNEKWDFNPATIDCMVLSHAHIDHTGRMPKLVKDGFRGRIFSTHATRDLAAIMLLDSAEIQESDREKDKEPLYKTADVAQTMRQFVGLSYETWFDIRHNVRLYFTDAGHILGSASVFLEVKEEGKTIRFGFSGDIGRYGRPILRDPQPMPKVDFLLCESTYGDRLHDDKPDEIARFTKIIRETCVEKRGKVIIPAFSVGRTQEIVHLLDQLITEGALPPIQTFVDSPLAVDATEIFIKHPECFDEKVHQYMMRDPNPFGFRTMAFVRSANDSKKIAESNEPCVIIASSGMATGGRIRHHLKNNIKNPNATIMIVGYASPHTPAGQLRKGMKKINLMNQQLDVRARVEVMESFSAHADYREILQFLDNQRGSVQKIWLVHGELDAQEVFVKHLNAAGFDAVEIPKIGDIVELNP